jgi:hypothetical protein
MFDFMISRNFALTDNALEQLCGLLGLAFMTVLHDGLFAACRQVFPAARHRSTGAAWL